MGIHNQQTVEKEMEQSQQGVIQRPLYVEADSGMDSERSRNGTFRDGVLELTERTSKDIKKTL